MSIVSPLGYTTLISVFLLSVVEGACRKWVSIPLGEALIVGRDVLAASLILYCWIRGDFVRVAPRLTWVMLIFSAILTLWGLVQYILGLTSVIGWLVGLRYYTLYPWFACACFVSLTATEWDRFSAWVKVLALPMAVLSLIQFGLPKGHFLNSLPNTTEDQIFVVYGDIVRATGTFSFAAGYSYFCLFAVPYLLVASSVEFPGKRLPKFLLGYGVGAVLAVSLVAVSGARSTVGAASGLVVVYCLSLLLPNSSSTRLGNPGGSFVAFLSVVFASLVLLLFYGDAIDAMESRIEHASYVESLSGRVLTVFFGEPHVWQDFPLLGLGLGSNTNMLNTTGLIVHAESEPGRVITELGVLGLVLLACKFVICLLALRMGLQFRLHYGVNFPLLMAFSSSVALISWPVSGQLTANVFCYLMLAACFSWIQNMPGRVAHS